MKRINDSKRVFIFGAGASVYAGFPLASGLWSFLLDHGGLETNPMDWINAHLTSLTPEAQKETTYDFEGLLHNYKMGRRPRVGVFRDKGTPLAKLTSEQRNEYRELLRHFSANPDALNLDAYLDAVETRRDGAAASWYPISMSILIKTLRTAFLHHHSCIKPPGGCRLEGESKRFKNCPCFPKRSFHQMNWRIRAAIQRLFRPGDVIVTFNWDCLLETFLWDAGLWNMTSGYGMPVTMHPSASLALSRARRKAIASLSPVRILKAHGSLNWRTNFEQDELGLDGLDELFDFPNPWSYHFSVDEHGEDISPFTQMAFLEPTYNKDYTPPIFKRLWQQITEAIQVADRIIVSGFSLPKSDVNARKLLSAALQENRICQTIELVTPESCRETEWAKIADSINKKVVKLGDHFECWALDQSRAHAHPSI